MYYYNNKILIVQHRVRNSRLTITRSISKSLTAVIGIPENQLPAYLLSPLPLCHQTLSLTCNHNRCTIEMMHREDEATRWALKLVWVISKLQLTPKQGRQSAYNAFYAINKIEQSSRSPHNHSRNLPRDIH